MPALDTLVHNDHRVYQTFVEGAMVPFICHPPLHLLTVFRPWGLERAPQEAP